MTQNMNELAMFKNMDEDDVVVRKRNVKKGFNWITVKKGDVVEIPRKYGKSLRKKGLVEVGDKVEKLDVARNEKRSVFANKLMSAKGVGAKITKDVMNIYETEDELTEALDKGEHIPVPDNLIKPLEVVFLKPKLAKDAKKKNK